MAVARRWSARGARAAIGVLSISGVARAQTPPSAPAPSPAPAPAPPSAPSPAPAPSPTVPAAAIVPPRVVTHVDAVYPPEALASGAHGEVVLAVTVDADGHVGEVRVLESGGKLLDDAAVFAASQWTFEPALRNGAPVAARIRIPFHFAPPTLLSHEAVAPARGAAATAPPAPPPHDEGPSPAPRAPTNDGGANDTNEPAEVRVLGHTRAPSRGASDYNTRVGELARVPRQNASELLKLAPGIMLSNEGGEGHAEQVFLRGFDAREGQDIEFTVGGVPINDSGNLHGSGYADTHFILPELVESVRVVEGPFDPRQGNYAVAGSADYELGLAKRGFQARTTLGSYGTERALFLWGPPGETTHTFGGVELYKTNGFGQNRDARRGNAMGQYEGRFGDRGLWRITATAYSTDYHSAGVLREDDVDAGRKKFFDTYDFGQGGQSSRFMVAGDIETRTEKAYFRQQVFAVRRGMRLRENFTGFLLDTQDPIQEPHGQRGDLLDLDTTMTTVGLKGFGRARTHALGMPQEIELGYFARGDDVSGTQQRVEAATGYPYKTETDIDAKLGDLGLYGDVDLHATRWITLRGGARADLFTYDVVDDCAVHDVAHPSTTSPPGDASCLSQEDFGRHREPDQRSSTASTSVMPRASVLLGPAQGFTFTGSAGEGVRSIDPVYVTQDAKTPFASVFAYEGGVVWAGGLPRSIELVARSVFFRTHVDKDLVFSETAGRNTLANGTTRSGWAGSLRATGSFFDLSGNVTLVRSTFDDTHLLVPYVPDAVMRVDGALFSGLGVRFGGHEVKGTLSTGVNAVGRRALPYGQRSDGMFTVDANAGLSWSAYDVQLAATNLFDARYRLGEFDYASDFHTQPQPTLVPARHFTAGAPRELFLTLGVSFGGES